MIESVVSLILVGLLVAIRSYEELLMPGSLVPSVAIGMVVVFLFFAALIWRELGEDERDDVHIQKAGRISFLVGSGILVAGITAQAFRMDIDPWLLYALIGMILSKLLLRIYFRSRM